MPNEKPTRPLPPTYLLASIVLMVMLHRFLPGWWIVEPPWTRLGAVPILIGFAVVCAWAFRNYGMRQKTTVFLNS